MRLRKGSGSRRWQERLGEAQAVGACHLSVSKPLPCGGNNGDASGHHTGLELKERLRRRGCALILIGLFLNTLDVLTQLAGVLAVEGLLDSLDDRRVLRVGDEHIRPRHGLENQQLRSRPKKNRHNNGDIQDKESGTIHRLASRYYFPPVRQSYGAMKIEDAPFYNTSSRPIPR